MNKDKQLYDLHISNQQLTWIKQVAKDYNKTIRSMIECCVDLAMQNETSVIDLYNQVKSNTFIIMRLNYKRSKLYLPLEKSEWILRLRNLTSCNSDSKLIDLCIMFARLNANDFIKFIEQQIHDK